MRDFGDPQVYLEPTFNGNNIIPANNVNWPQLDVPEINQAMGEASLLIDQAERAEAWAEIDRMVTEQAATVNWLWDKTPNIQSTNVVGVVDEINGLWDYGYTSIK